VKQRPEARTYYELSNTAITFVLPEPGFLEGIKSKDRAILKMHNVKFTCVCPCPFDFLCLRALLKQGTRAFS
jgi:hypothetical protein